MARVHKLSPLWVRRKHSEIRQHKQPLIDHATADNLHDIDDLFAQIQRRHNSLLQCWDDRQAAMTLNCQTRAYHMGRHTPPVVGTHALALEERNKHMLPRSDCQHLWIAGCLCSLRPVCRPCRLNTQVLKLAIGRALVPPTINL